MADEPAEAIDFIAKGSGRLQRPGKEFTTADITINQGERVRFGPAKRQRGVFLPEVSGAYALKIGVSSVFIVPATEIDSIRNQLTAFSDSPIVKPVKCEACGNWDGVKERTLTSQVPRAYICRPCWTTVTSAEVARQILFTRVMTQQSPYDVPALKLDLEPIQAFTAVVDNGPIYVVYPANRFNLEIRDRDIVKFGPDFDDRRWIAGAGRDELVAVGRSQVVWDKDGIQWVYAELLKLRESSDIRLTEEASMSKMQLQQRTRFRHIFSDIHVDLED